MNIPSIIVTGFGIETAAVSVLVAIVSAVVKKYSDKLPRFISRFAAISFALVAGAACEALFSENAEAGNILYVGLTSYSLGTVIYAMILKLFRGEKLGEKELALLLESILRSVCSDADACRKTAEALSDATKIPASVGDVVEVIKNTLKDGVSESEMLSLAETILRATEKFKKEK